MIRLNLLFVARKEKQARLQENGGKWHSYSMMVLKLAGRMLGRP